MPESLPLVSIVTPSLDQGAFIEEAIRSVLGQDYPHVEHIVVDGGSTDGTLEILRRHPHLRWISEPDCGQSEAVNKGFAMAQGTIFGWLNADDVYLPGAVRAAVETIRRTGCGLVYGGYRKIDEQGRVLREEAARPFDPTAQLDTGNVVPQPAAFFTREAFEAVGGLDPELHYAMDYDLWSRIATRFAVVPADGTWAAFRVHGASKTVAQQERFWREERRVGRRHGGPVLSQMLIWHIQKRRPRLADYLGRAARGREFVRRRHYRLALGKLLRALAGR